MSVAVPAAYYPALQAELEASVSCYPDRAATCCLVAEVVHRVSEDGSEARSRAAKRLEALSFLREV